MHDREQIELAALVSDHGPELVEGSQHLPQTHFEAYWVASKCRLDRWGRSLRELAASSDQPSDDSLVRTRTGPAVVQEILATEVLTRVWTAVVCAFDRLRQSAEVEPVARSAMIGHLEARHRAMCLLLKGTGLSQSQCARLNQLRRKAECWSNLLVGRLAAFYDVAEFAVDPAAARLIGKDYELRRARSSDWEIQLSALRAAFCETPWYESPNTDLNQQVTSSIIACFRSELFHATGVMRSLWLTRLIHSAEATQGMLDELFVLEKGPVPSAAHQPDFDQPPPGGPATGGFSRW